MRWLGVCLDMICVVFVAFVVFLAIATQSGSGKKTFVNQRIQIMQNLTTSVRPTVTRSTLKPSLSFDTFVSSFPLAESQPRDPQIPAY